MKGSKIGKIILMIIGIIALSIIALALINAIIY